jgi:hypothetical protein
MKPSRAARDRDGGKNFDGFSLPPHNIVVIGVDTSHGPEHPLYSAQACELANGTRDYDMRMLRSLHAFGVKVPVSVRHETVPAGDDAELWPKHLKPGDTAHVLVTGRRRVIHGRRVAEEKFTAGEIGELNRWQVKCVLEHAKRPQEIVSIVADENVCRRVLEDDEIAEGIQRGLSVSLTLDEMAERYGVSVDKAKRLLRRAEGVPEKPTRETIPRPSASILQRAVAELTERGGMHDMENAEVAQLVECIRGRRRVADCSHFVQALLSEHQEEAE